MRVRPKRWRRWIEKIETALDEFRRAHPERKVAPFAVNQIIHQSNDRLEHDLDVCVRHRVPIIITSLRAPTDVVKEYSRIRRRRFFTT